MPNLSSLNRVLLWSALLCFASSAAAQEEVNVQRINAACVLELGRLPTQDELSESSELQGLSIESAMEALATLADEDVARRAFRDAYGKVVSAPKNGGESYIALMRTHVENLKNDAAAYREVLNRAYQFVIHRDPYEEEYAYWSERGTLPYLLLVGCIEDWARRNQPGLMVTAGDATVSVNCELLGTARLSPEVAAEAKAVVGITANACIVAIGGEVPLSSGGVNFVACGR